MNIPNSKRECVHSGLPLLLAVTIVFLTSTKSLPGAVGGKPEKTDVIVTYQQPSGAFTPIWVAYEAGFFKKYGINAQLELLPAAGQAVVSEAADFYTNGPDLINARLKGAAVKYFGGTMQQFVFQIWGAKEITDIKQLQGKTMAVTIPRAAIDIATREALKKSGLMPDNEVKLLYAQTVPAVLTSILSGKTLAGTLSAPNTLKAREAGLNLLVDIARLSIPGLQVAYGTTERYLSRNPNTIYAFLKAIAEGIVLARKTPLTAKKAIVKYAKVSEPRIVDDTYDTFSPYWEMNLRVKADVINAHLGYIDEKEVPNAKKSSPQEFIDNSFVETLQRSGFFKQIGFGE